MGDLKETQDPMAQVLTAALNVDTMEAELIQQSASNVISLSRRMPTRTESPESVLTSKNLCVLVGFNLNQFGEHVLELRHLLGRAQTLLMSIHAETHATSSPRRNQKLSGGFRMPSPPPADILQDLPAQLVGVVRTAETSLAQLGSVMANVSAGVELLRMQREREKD